MDEYVLPFAKIIVLREDIVEVIINKGVEMNVSMVDQYHDFLVSHLRAPFSLLVNKVNSYSYDFEAQQKLATLNEINAMGVVAYTGMADISTKSLTGIPRNIEWNLKIFSSRDEALVWLELEQARVVGQVGAFL